MSRLLPQIERDEARAAPPPYRRRSRREFRFSRRGWIAAGLVAIVVLVGVGAYLAYDNTLPTKFTTNFKDGQQDVPADSRVLLSFNRPVAQSAVEAAFSMSPATDGAITAISGQTQYAWAPSKRLNELTTYTLTMKPIFDVGHHRGQSSTCSCTTPIVPRVVSITGPGASDPPLADGTEIDPGATLRLNFNDTMDPPTIKPTPPTHPTHPNSTTTNNTATLSP